MTISPRPVRRARAPRGSTRSAGSARTISVRTISVRAASAAAVLSAVVLVPLVAACGSDTAPDGTPGAPVGVLAKRFGVTVVTEPAPDVTGAENLDRPPTVAAGNGTPPSGSELVVVDLVAGRGEVAAADSSVTVQYLGTMWDDGSEFDSSWSRGEPAIFPLDGVVPGFGVGVEGMRVGGRRLLVVPPDLGYGPAGGRGSISATDTLVFVVDLVAVDESSTTR